MTKHLNQAELADRWGISPRTLECWRWRGRGPRFLKVGRRVAYRLQDIEAYEADRLGDELQQTESAVMEGGDAQADLRMTTKYFDRLRTPSTVRSFGFSVAGRAASQTMSKEEPTMTSTVTSEQAARRQRLSPAGFRAWLTRSSGGDVVEYHRGFVSRDRSPLSELDEDQRRLAAAIADAAMAAAEKALVHLVQRRNGPFDYSYLAIKASVASWPAAERCVTPSEQVRHGGFEHPAILPLAA